MDVAKVLQTHGIGREPLRPGFSTVVASLLPPIVYSFFLPVESRVVPARVRAPNDQNGARERRVALALFIKKPEPRRCAVRIA